MAAIVPLEDAVASIEAKTPIGSLLRSADWERVPIALKQRAQFSAGVESARVLQTIQDRLSSAFKQQREQLASGAQATFDRSSFINAVRDIARGEGLTPEKEELRGGIQDITSIPRLGLIYDMQNAMATGFARHKLDTSEGALLLYPAYRLSASSAKEPRPQIWWEQRWAEAGAAVNWEGAAKDQMVALKTSPIWAKLSRFGVPWAPFDWGSTRELEEVDRDEAIALGLMKPDDLPPEAAEGGEDFNQELEASTKGLSDELKGFLTESFGDDVTLSKDKVRWTAQAPPPRRRRASPPPEPSEPPTDTEVIATQLKKQKFAPVIVEAARKMPSTVSALVKTAEFHSTRGGAYYRRSDKGIRMGKNPQKWSGTEQTFHHEVGHHLHYETGVIKEGYTAPEFTKVVMDDLAGWQKGAADKHGAQWTQIYKHNSRLMLDEIATQIGLEKFNPLGDMEGAKRVGRVADTIMGLTRGKYGSGHDVAYMQKYGDMEVFAHAYSAIIQNDQHYQKLFPNAVAYVKELLKL